MADNIRFLSLDLLDRDLGIEDAPPLIHTAYLARKWFSPGRPLVGGRYIDVRPKQAEVIEACEYAFGIADEFRKLAKARADPDVAAAFPDDDDGGEDDLSVVVRAATYFLEALTEQAELTGDPALPDFIRSLFFPRLPTLDALEPLSNSAERKWSARQLLSAMLLLVCDRAAAEFRAGNVSDLAVCMGLAGELRAAAAMTFEAERHERATRERTARLNDERHRKNRDARQMVVADWLADRTRFRSADSAAVYYVEWLQSKGFDIGSFRTVSGWIRSAARANGIKLR